jgi:hypothetical protein
MIITEKTRVVHFKKEPFDVYVGRPSVWGNPYEIGKDGTRAEVIAKYKEYLLGNDELMKLLPMLKGRVLGCWCHPEACHGDVIAELADASNLLQF